MSEYDDKAALQDKQILALLANETPPMELSAELSARLQDRIMARIDEKPKPSFRTVRAKEGRWLEIGEKLKKKILYCDPDTGIESYLLKMAPGVEIKAHKHLGDETCLVLEGGLNVDGLSLESGDFHIAKAGSVHQLIYSEQGALVFLQHPDNHFI